MPRPKTPFAKAKALGAADRHPERYLRNDFVAPSLPLGEPPKRLKPAAAAAWNEFRDELPWLDCSHGGILGIAAILRGRMAVGDPSSKAMNLLRLCLGQATLA